MVQKSAGANQFCQLSMELSRWWLVGGCVREGGAETATSPGVCQDLPLEENCTEFRHWNGIEKCGCESVLSIEYGVE